MAHQYRIDLVDEELEERSVSIGQQEQLVEVSTENFDQLVMNSPLPVLVNFQTPWSKQMVPLLGQIAATFGGRLRVVQVNISTDPELAARFKIRAVPTLLIFNNGVPIEFIVGTVPSRFILQIICKTIGVAPHGSRVRHAPSSTSWPSVWTLACDSTCV